MVFHFVEIGKLSSKFSPVLAKRQRLKREGKNIPRFAYLFNKQLQDVLWSSGIPVLPHTPGASPSF